jgi:hypothetical protein
LQESDPRSSIGDEMARATVDDDVDPGTHARAELARRRETSYLVRTMRRSRGKEAVLSLSQAFALGTTVWLITGCPRGARLSAAEEGNLPVLGREIDSGERAASLGLSEVADLARATASREVSTAKGDAAVERVREVRACAPELREALSARTRTHDVAGALAASALLDVGLFGAEEARSFSASPDDAWRVLGVRALTRSGDADARRRALLDPSPTVRRSALRAMEHRPDVSDLQAVFEAARVDPDPMVRTDALRLMPRFARVSSDPSKTAAEVTRLLGDIYPTAGDLLREEIGAAWVFPEEFAHGGREALRVLLAAADDPATLSAAAAVLDEPHLVDPELTAAARAALLRAIGSGSRRNRLHAIAVVPLSGTSLEPRTPRGETLSPFISALEKTSLEEDLDVRVSALGRLSSPAAPASGRARATLELEAIAARTDDRPLASRARALLAQAGDVRGQAWIEEDLRSVDAWARLSAVGALVALGRASRAAPILADADASVRTRGACALLLASRFGPSLR